MAKFLTIACGATWRPNFQLMQVKPTGGHIFNNCKWCHLVAKQSYDSGNIWYLGDDVSNGDKGGKRWQVDWHGVEGMIQNYKKWRQKDSVKKWCETKRNDVKQKEMTWNKKKWPETKRNDEKQKVMTWSDSSWRFACGDVFSNAAVCNSAVLSHLPSFVSLFEITWMEKRKRKIIHGSWQPRSKSGYQAVTVDIRNEPVILLCFLQSLHSASSWSTFRNLSLY